MMALIGCTTILMKGADCHAKADHMGFPQQLLHADTVVLPTGFSLRTPGADIPALDRPFLY